MTKRPNMSASPVSRRHLLLAMAGSGAVATGLYSATSLFGSTHEADLLDLNFAPDNLTAYLKMRGSLIDEQVAYLISGRVYAIVEKAAAQPFFGIVGFQVSRYRRLSEDLSAAATHYFAIYTDLSTGQRAERLNNPISGANNVTPLSFYGPSEMFLTPSSMSFGSADNGLKATMSDVRAWERTGDVVQISDEIFAPAETENLPDLDITTYRSQWSDVQNPELNSIPCTMGFTAVEDWRDWMEMGDVEGSLLWHVTGHKMSTGEPLPNHFEEQVRAAAPEMLAPDWPPFSDL